MRKNDLAQILFLLTACRVWQRHFDAMQQQPSAASRARVVPLRRITS